MKDRSRRLHSVWRPLATIALLCLVAAPAEGQRRRGIGQRVRTALTDLHNTIAGPLPPRAPRNLEPCGSMYGPKARQIARGAEPVNSRVRWLEVSYELIRDIGPLPICFEHLRDTLTRNEGWRLLHVNNYYLDRHPQTSYRLIGYPDPVERDTALARRRSERIHRNSTEPQCRFRTQRGALQTEAIYHRKVYYTPLGPAGCRPPPSR